MTMRKKKRPSLRNQMIQYNLTIMILALVLCAAVLVVSVGVIVGGHIQSDIEFLLTATADSADAKFDYCADVVTNVRKSDVLNDYLLKNAEYIYSEEEFQLLQDEFDEKAAISGQSITGDGISPLVEQVYLFKLDGDYITTTYYPMMHSEIAISNSIFEGIYQEYRKDLETGKDYGYYPMSKKTFCLAFPVLNDQMNQIGTLLYQIDNSVLDDLMIDIAKYEESFFVLVDADGNIVYGNNLEAIGDSKEKLLESFGNKPFSVELEGTSYEMYRSRVGLNLDLFLAIPQNQFITLMYDSIRVYAITIVIIMAVACTLLILMIYRMTRPIKEVTDKLQEVKTGNFLTKLPDYDNSEFHEISLVFNDMTAYIDNLIKQVYEKQLSIKDMEMKFLQTQMNPHFMFNVLNTIALQAQMDGNQEVYKMINSFSQLIQAKIYSSQSDKVKICQELEYVNYYLYLQNYRYGDRLSYKIEIDDPNLTEYYIPKLCIQLLVENAVVHGIEPLVGNGEVRVHIYSEENKICIDTIDNGVGFEKNGEIMLPLQPRESNKSHNHVGLNNSHHIIQLMYGKEYGVRVFSEKGKGTKVCIRIPFDESR